MPVVYANEYAICGFLGYPLIPIHREKFLMTIENGMKKLFLTNINLHRTLNFVIAVICLSAFSGNASAAEVIAVQSERDVVIVKLNAEEMGAVSIGDKIEIFLPNRKESLTGTIKDVVENKAKMSIFEGVSALNLGALVSLKKKETTQLELQNIRLKNELEEEISSGKRNMVTGGVCLVLGAVLYATGEKEDTSDSCLVSTSCQQRQNSIRLSNILNLLSMSIGAISIVYGYNQYTEAESKRNKGVAIAFEKNI